MSPEPQNADTSYMAYQEIQPRIDSIKDRIIQVMRETPEEDWASRELAFKLNEYGGTISPRLRIRGTGPDTLLSDKTLHSDGA